MSNQRQEMVTEEAITNRFSWKKVGRFFTIFALLILVTAFSFSFYKIWQANIGLVHHVVSLENALKQTQQQVQANQQATINLQGVADKAQTLAARQEQLLTEWQAAQKGNLSKWSIAEAQYLVKLAQDHVLFMQDIALARSLLQYAEQSLQTMADPNLATIRQSLASDIAHLQALPEANTTKIYMQLSLINSQLDQLPLPSNLIKPVNAAENKTIQPAQSWWQGFMDKSLQAFNKIVIVRYTGGNALPLVMPEEKTFLYQNLHAQMENAMWAVLNRNNEVYQASLVRMIAWVNKYFVQESAETQNVLKNLQELKNISVQPTAVINLAPTIQLFDDYLRKA